MRRKEHKIAPEYRQKTFRIDLPEFQYKEIEDRILFIFYNKPRNSWAIGYFEGETIRHFEFGSKTHITTIYNFLCTHKHLVKHI